MSRVLVVLAQSQWKMSALRQPFKKKKHTQTPFACILLLVSFKSEQQQVTQH